MARTILMAGFTASQTDFSSPQYCNITGGMTPDLNQGLNQTKFFYAGTLYDFGVNVRANAQTTTYTFTVQKNTVDTVLSVAIGAGQTGWFEDNDTLSISAGDLVEVKGTKTGGEANFIEFTAVKTEYDTNTSTTNTISILSGNAGGTTASATFFFPLNGIGGTTLTEAHAQSKMQYSATLRNLYIRITSNSRTTTTTYRTRKNGANGNQSIAVGSGQTGSFEDIVNTDSVVSGDLICLSKTNSTGTQGQGCTVFQVDHQTTTDPGTGLLILSNSGSTTMSEPLTRWQLIAGSATNFASSASTESFLQIKVKSAFIFKGLAVLAGTNAINATSVFTLRKNSTDTSLTASVPSTSTAWAQDTTNTVTVASGDLINHQIVTPSVGGSQVIGIKQILVYTEIAGFSSLRNLTALASHNIIITDTSYNRTRTRARAITENIIVQDTSFIRGRGKTRAVSDHPVIGPITSSHVRLVNKIRDITAQNITIAANMTKLANKARTSIHNVIVVDTSYIRNRGKTRAVSDHPPIPISSNHLKQANKVRSLTGQNIGIIASNHLRLKSAARAMTSPLFTVISVASQSKFKIKSISENITITAPTFNRLTNRIRTTSENLFSIASIHLQDRNKVKIIIESFSILSNHVKSTTRVRSISENITITAPTFIKLTNKLRSISQNIFTIASIHLQDRNKVRIIVESFSILSNHVKSTNRIRTTSENIGAVTSNHLRTKNKVRSITNHPTITVSLATANRLTGRLKTTLHAIGVTAVTSKSIPKKVRAISENISIISNHVKSVNRIRTTISNIVVTGTSFIQSKFKIKTTLHNIGIVSNHLRLRNLNRSPAAENINITSITTRFRQQITRTITHNVTITSTAAHQFFKRFYVRFFRISGNR